MTRRRHTMACLYDLRPTVPYNTGARVMALATVRAIRLPPMDTKVADPLNGALLGGRYRVVGRLASGGMATVYQARDERLDRIVAIKIMHPDRARDPRFLSRLTDEAKTVARLAHPNVVAVYDQGTHEDAPYVVMELVRGRTLREVLGDRQRLDPSEALAVLEQILAALAVAHRAGLVHRDVKPENILIALPPNGSGDLVDAVVKVADFGIARAAEVAGRPGDGQTMGTAEYVAPELVTDGRADPRADVYSVGIVLFEMVTGRVPFDGDQPADIAWRHVDHDVSPPSQVIPGLPAVMDHVVLRATRRDPAGRPSDAAAMLAQVQSAREEVGALVGPTRAMAHPTVASPTVEVMRPSWARLPAPRDPLASRSSGGPLAAARSSVAAAGRRIAERLPGGSVSGALASARGSLGRMRTTAAGRRKLTAVLVAIGLVLLAGGWWLGFGRYTEAPPLVQLTKENAIAEATRLGFSVEYGAGLYAEEIPKDTVIKQNPEPGRRIVRGGTVTLYLSLGPERYPIPEVAGQSSDFATAQLKDHFVVETMEGYSDNLPADFVVGTDPPAGTQLKPNSVVKMVISKGGFPVHVPTVLGRPRAEAESQLAALGFTVETQVREDQTKPRDLVLEQNPSGGHGLPTAKGVKVVLIVASGPPGTPMPSVIGAGCNDATVVLQGLGFNVTVDADEISRQFGHVKGQSPNPNEPVQPGQQVQIQCGLF
jgi:eukaryotic-like serine/threonine-protein kinase